MARKIKVDVELNPSNMDKFLNKLESRTENALNSAFRKAQSSQHAYESKMEQQRREEREEREKTRRQERLNRTKQQEKEKAEREAQREEQKSERESVRRVRSIGSAIGMAISSVTRIVGTLVGVAGKGVSTVGRLVSISTNAVNNAIGSVTNVITQTLSSAQGMLSQIPVIGNLLSIPLSFGKSGVSAISNISKGLIGGVGSTVGGALQGVGGAIGGVGSGIAILGGSVGAGVTAGTIAGGPAGGIIGGVIGALAGVLGGGSKIATSAMGGTVSLVSGALKGVTGLLEGLSKAIIEAPVLIEDTARKLIRTMLLLAGSIAGITKLTQKDTESRLAESNTVNGSFSANPLGTLSEPYTRKMERYRKGLKYYGKAAPFNLDSMLAASEKIQENIQDTMTGQGFSDRFAIDENWVLTRLGLGKKYNLRDMLSNGRFDSMQFIEDVMRSIEANPYALLNDTILREAVENIIGKNNVNAAVASYNNRLSNGQLPMFDMILSLGYGAGTTAPTKNMAEFQKAMARLAGSLDEAKRNISAGLLPVLTDLADKVRDVIDTISGKINNFFFESNGRTIFDDIKDGFTESFGSMTQFKTDIKDSFSYISDYFKYLMNAIGTSVMAIVDAVKIAFSPKTAETDEYKSAMGGRLSNIWKDVKTIGLNPGTFTTLIPRLIGDVFNIHPIKDIGIRKDMAWNYVSGAVGDAFSQNRMRFEDMVTSVKSVGMLDRLADFVKGTALGFYYGYGADEDDMADYSKTQSSKVDQVTAQEKGRALRRRGEWENNFAGMLYTNIDNYMGMSNAMLERIMKEAMDKAGINTDDALWGKGGALDANTKYGAHNPEEYFKYVISAWLKENANNEQLNKFVEALYSMTQSAWVNYNEGDKPRGTRIDGYGDITIVVNVDGNGTHTKRVIKNGIANGG